MTEKELKKPDDMPLKDYVIDIVSSITVSSAMMCLEDYLQYNELLLMKMASFNNARMNNGLIGKNDRELYNKVQDLDIAYVKGGLIGRICVMETDDLLCLMDVLAKNARKGFIW